jgi:hypothetical protein
MDSLRPVLEDFVSGTKAALGLDREGTIVTTAPALLFPGAVNPVHAGHWQLARAAERRLESAAAFEISIVNVDKPPLNAEELGRRLVPLLGRVPVWMTRLPTFLEKARRFPGVVFVVGADTAERILAPRYYSGGARGMRQGLAEIRSHGCRFLVGGRLHSSGRFVCLDGLSISAEFADMFLPIPEEDFRQDISSTAIRAEQTT